MTVHGPKHARVDAVDIGRTVALAGMIVFHFVRDLEFFGYLPHGTSLSGIWFVLARVVAGSFFFLSGISLFLAHRDAIHWGSFWRRFSVIGVAALAISAATYAAMPSRFIYFGILHSIAICSLAGLVFVRAPVIFTVSAAICVLAVHFTDWHPLNSAFWSFTGLSLNIRPSLDLLPLVPWLSALLFGIAVGRVWDPVPGHSSGVSARLGWPGRHSLAIYLIHQPVLLAVLWALS